MTAMNMARTAYATPGTPARSLRGIEYDLFARVTHRLKTASESGNTPALAAALHDNLRLWAVLAADVAEPGNALPSQLRARLFYLYEFTSQHNGRVLAGKASAGVLVDINTAVMRGLRGEGVAP